MKKFVYGLFTGLFIIPILDSICSLIQAWIEAFKTTPNLKVFKYNQQASQLSAEIEPTDTNVIGFQIPSDERDEEYWDE